MEKEAVLVSVVIVCYNAERYIIEAMDSVKNQTYQNIELIITDDCSNDDTYSICEKWIENNAERFRNVILTRTGKNSGVAVNINNGCKKTNGEWIKLMAGDDLLPRDVIEKNIKYVTENKIEYICCSKSLSFVERDGMKKCVDIKPDYYTEKVFNMDAKSQYKKMLYEYVILLPTTAFISNRLFEKIGYFDEKFPEIEDYPFFLKIGENGIKINYNPSLIGY